MASGIKQATKWSEDEIRKLCDDFHGYKKWNGLVTYQPGNFVLSPNFEKYKERFHNFKVS